MFTFLAIVHIVVSVFMVVFILLQDPKGGSGGALGMLGGGSSKSLFGSTGGNQFLVNVTKWMAVIFAFTSIYLAALSSQKKDSVMEQYTEEASNNESTTKEDTEKTGDEPTGKETETIVNEPTQDAAEGLGGSMQNQEKDTETENQKKE